MKQNAKQNKTCRGTLFTLYLSILFPFFPLSSGCHRQPAPAKPGEAPAEELQVTWLRSLHNTYRISSNRYSELAVDSLGNSYVACFAMRPDRTEFPLIIKVSPAGQVLWKVDTGGNGRACGITLLPDGDLLVTGHFQQELTLPPLSASTSGSQELWLARVDEFSATNTTPR